MAKDILYPLRRLHGILHEENIRFQKRQYLKKQFNSKFKQNPHTVFLVMTPEHGNLGDHAIVSAETEMLKKHEIDYIEITDVQLQEWQYNRILDVMNGHPILITGGGNLGTLWFQLEKLQRNIISENLRSPVFVLPNTIFYEYTDWGRTELANSKKIYNRHKNLHLYARENLSYEFMRENYRNVSLVPDMVLALNRSDDIQERLGCIVCLRSDCEKTRTEEQEWQIREQLQSLFGSKITYSDMVIHSNVSVEQRERALEKKFTEFAQAELVITDRLHGMIFCAVTGTPCIVVDSKSPKLRGCYEWIKHLDYIRFADDVTEIAEIYHSIPKKIHWYDNQHLLHYYDKLASDILKGLK